MLVENLRNAFLMKKKADNTKCMRTRYNVKSLYLRYIVLTGISRLRVSFSTERFSSVGCVDVQPPNRVNIIESNQENSIRF